MKLVDRPPVEMELVGADGNAFAILGRFQGAARDAGWSKEEIETVHKAATSGDYNNLLRVIMDHIEDIGDDDFDEDFDDEDDEY